MANTVQIDPASRVACFDVDCQYCFTPECPDELPVPDALAIVPHLNAQARFASLRLGSKDAHSPKAVWVADSDDEQFAPVEGANVDIKWKKHAVPGTKGFELIAGLPAIPEYDYFVWKGVELDMHPYGACFHDFAKKMSTGVIEFLRARDITTVIVGGLATDYCVKNTVLQLLGVGFKVVLNLAACRGIAAETVEQAKKDMLQAGAVIVSSTDELVQETQL